MTPEVRAKQREIQTKSRELRTLVQSLVQSEAHRAMAEAFLKTGEMWAVDGCLASDLLARANVDEKF